MSLERMELINRLSSLTIDAETTAQAMDDYAEVLFEPERNRWRNRAVAMRANAAFFGGLIKEMKPKEVETE